MVKRALFIFDENIDVPNLAKSINQFGGGRIDLFSLTSKWRLIYEIEGLFHSTGTIGFEVRLLESANLIHNEVAEVREKVSSWSADLGDYIVGGQAIKEWFLTQRKEVSTWWFSLISEKNTLKTDVFFYIAQIQAIDKLIGSSEYNICYLSMQNRNLKGIIKRICTKHSVQIEMLGIVSARSYIRREVIKGYLAKFGFLKDILHSSLWLAISLLRSLRARTVMGPLYNRPLLRDSILFVTYFPAVENKAAEKGIFENKYAIPLQRKLSEMKKPINWLLIYGPLGGHSRMSALRLGKRFANNGEVVFFLEEFLTFWVFLNSIVTWLSQIFKYLLLMPRLKREFLTEKLTIPEANMLLYAIWRQSFIGKIGMEGIVFFEIYKRVFDYFSNSSHCVYYAEMQAWEKALNAAKRIKPRRIKTIGFQHVTIPSNLFNYFHHPSETEKMSSSADLPLPDILACNGDIPFALMKKQKYPRLEKLEAVRQLYLEPYIAHTNYIKSNIRILLVVGSINRNETVSIIYLLNAAFSNPQPFKIWLKSHPAMPMEEIFESLGIDYKKCGYEIKKGPVSELLKDVTAIIVGSSTVALESIAFGCGVFVPIFSDQMFMSPLGGFDRLYKKICNPQQLKDIAEKTIQQDGQWIDRNEGRDFVLNYWCLDSSLKRWEKQFVT